MARPPIIEKLYEAKLELRLATLQEKAEKLRVYEQILKEAAQQYGAKAEELERALRGDYRIFLKQEGLPRLRPPRSLDQPPAP